MAVSVRLVATLFGATLASGCLLAAAGAGAGGAVYVSERGVESTVAASPDRALVAARTAFQAYDVRETKTSSEQDGALTKRTLEGATGDREVTVSIRTEGEGSRVVVVAAKTAVTWDKDFARAILERISSELR
ncbi:MAG: hypothetical protein ACYC2K_04585 [Gemmatimonadales bacterium]